MQLVEAYFNNDQQVLADMQLLYARPLAEPTDQADATPASSFRVLLFDSSRATLKACIGVLSKLGISEIATTQDGYEWWTRQPRNRGSTAH